MKLMLFSSISMLCGEPCTYICTVHVQDDLLVGVIFGGFACGKKLADFILAISCHVPLSMLRLKQNGGFYIGDFFIETPIANINPRQ